MQVEILIRAGGTSLAGPVLAGPLFSEQVINIHNLKSYAVVWAYGFVRTFAGLHWCTRERQSRLGRSSIDRSARAYRARSDCACLAMLEIRPEMHQNRS